MQRKWLILTALAMEARAIADIFQTPLAPPGKITVLVATEAQLAVVGIGATRLDPEFCRGWTGGIILAGLAGALDPTLRIGEVVIDRNGACNPLPDPPPECQGREKIEVLGPWPALPFREGKIHTASNVVTTAAQKAELFRQTGALAVDMESEPVRRRAIEAGVPLLVIRAISDGAEDAVPGEVLRWIDPQGRPRLGRTLAGMAMNPLLIPSLIRLGRRSNQAVKAMAAAVERVLSIAAS